MRGIEEQRTTAVNTSTVSRPRTLCLCVSYGGRDDIVQTCKLLLAETQHNATSGLPLADIDEAMFARRTMTGRARVSDPDLVVRSGGDWRLSNFLLWQSAYAELAVLADMCMHTIRR